MWLNHAASSNPKFPTYSPEDELLLIQNPTSSDLPPFLCCDLRPTWPSEVMPSTHAKYLKLVVKFVSLWQKQNTWKLTFSMALPRVIYGAYKKLPLLSALWISGFALLALLEMPPSVNAYRLASLFRWCVNFSHDSWTFHKLYIQFDLWHIYMHKYIKNSAYFCDCCVTLQCVDLVRNIITGFWHMYSMY